MAAPPCSQDTALHKKTLSETKTGRHIFCGSRKKKKRHKRKGCRTNRAAALLFFVLRQILGAS
jgi:hypothetical protein